jgi:hypothetical protein
MAKMKKMKIKMNKKVNLIHIHLKILKKMIKNNKIMKKFEIQIKIIKLKII